VQNRADRNADIEPAAPVSEITEFGAIVLAVSTALFVALLAMRLADRASIPYAALILVITAGATAVWTGLGKTPAAFAILTSPAKPSGS